MRTTPWMMGMFLLGCAVPGPRATDDGTRPYVPFEADVEATRTEVFRSVIDHALAQGWQIVEADSERGIVIARSWAEDRRGTLSRERWIFRIGNSTVSAQVIDESQLDPDQDSAWLASGRVGKSYHYAREREAIATIIARVSGDSVDEPSSSMMRMARAKE